MNFAPHSHQIKVRDRGSHWSINYGDQDTYPDKPFHWPWRSEDSYAVKCAQALRVHIVRAIREHDQKTRLAERLAGLQVVNFPVFDEDQWGSEQLVTKP